MKSIFKYVLIFLLIPAFAVANNGNPKGKHTKEKTIKKQFTVNASANLKIDNSYGNVDIVSWNENRIEIEVTIKTNGNDEDKVQKKLDGITVEFSGSASQVSAKTKFAKKNNSSWSLFGGKNSNVNMEVHYKVKMPVTNSLNVSNDYGAISLNRLEGHAKIYCDYGKLSIGDLLADDNYLSFDYTSNSNIEYMKSGKINADYSSFTLVKAENIELIADYTQSEFGSVNDINYNCDYGKVKIEKATNIIARGDYVTNKIGTINGNANFNTYYGSITIKNLSASAKDVTILSDYTGIKIGFSAGYNFDFDINLQYASLKGEDLFKLEKTIIKNREKHYSGYHGLKGSGNTININSEYGGVTFTKN